MKNIIITFISITVIFFTSCNEAENNGNNESDTTNISLGAGYVTNLYYNLNTGAQTTAVTDNWDIAFFTDIMSSTIITNDGSGVKLYTYPDGDIKDWDQTLSIDNVDLENYLYNSDSTWELGAFEKNQSGHPDYGWGTYSMSTHNITGDSIYIIQLVDESYKKLIIERKASSENTYFFKYANLDGTNMKEAAFDLSGYTNKNFGYYSLVNQIEVDREPASEAWDLLFTTYVAEIPTDIGFIPYHVSGVLANTGVSVSQVHGNPENITLADTSLFSENISTIGHDWKDFNMNTFSYTIEPDVSYFVKAKTGGIFHIVFTGFEGTDTGNLSFVATKVK